MEWKTVPISLICKGIYEGPHATPQSSECGAYYLGIPALTVDGHIDFSKVPYISKEDYVKWTKRVTPKYGDIVFTNEATLNLYARIPKDFYGCLGRRLGLVRPLQDKVNVDYLFYYFFSPYWRNVIALKKVSGSTVERILMKKFPNFPVVLPPIEIQQKIASILSTYDNLIENNTKRIKLLEQMAENLYKEWFVRFRFPEYKNVGKKESKLGKIPTSFDITNMDSVFDYYIGGGWGNEDKSDGFPIEASVIRGADFPSVWHYDVSTCPRRYHKTSNYKARQLEDGDIVMEISGGTAEQPVGRTVLVTQDMIDRFDDGKVICASFCKLIRLKKDIISPYYFYYWMHYLWDTRIIDRFQLQSTGIINFKFEPFLKKGVVLLPPKELMMAFEKQIVPMFKNINSLAKQNEYLSKQRDLLLPRLMSGKLEVKA